MSAKLYSVFIGTMILSTSIVHAQGIISKLRLQFEKDWTVEKIIKARYATNSFLPLLKKAADGNGKKALEYHHEGWREANKQYVPSGVDLNNHKVEKDFYIHVSKVQLRNDTASLQNSSDKLEKFSKIARACDENVSKGLTEDGSPGATLNCKGKKAEAVLNFIRTPSFHSDPDISLPLTEVEKSFQGIDIASYLINAKMNVGSGLGKLFNLTTSEKDGVKRHQLTELTFPKQYYFVRFIECLEYKEVEKNTCRVAMSFDIFEMFYGMIPAAITEGDDDGSLSSSSGGWSDWD